MSRCRCRFHEGCTVHDDDGRRWESYTEEEIAALDHLEVEVQTETTEWNCYCGRHGDDHLMAVGTKCLWQRTSYEYDEWECWCLTEYRDTWLSHQSIDWMRIGRREDRRYWAACKLKRYVVYPFRRALHALEDAIYGR